MVERWVESSRGRTHYWISRKAGAPALVFLHGMTADHTLFDRQIEYFRQDYTVLAWDAPAHGASRPYEDFSFLHSVVELKRILDAEEIRRCVMIGQSMGGMQAQVFIAHWPERVRGFVGIDTCPTDARFYKESELRWLARVGGLCRLYPFKTLHFGIAHRSARTVYGRANMRVALEAYSRRELIALMGACYGAMAREVDAGIPQCPTLLLMGEKDRVGRVRAYCAAWHGRTGAPLYRVRKAGHNANADNPRSVNRRIHAFVNSLPVEIRP